MVESTTPVGLWRSACAHDPSRPFVTAYDETGGRVELSYATLDNWVAKTANMIVDGLAALPGERIVLALPIHWQSIAWLLACWHTGTVAVPAAPEDGEPLPEGDIVVCGPRRLDTALDSTARDVVATSLHPMGAPLADCPPPALDYASEVRGFADQFRATGALDGAAAACDWAGETISAGELAARGSARAKDWELTSADRVAIITDAAQSPGVAGSGLAWLLAPVCSASGLMLTSDNNSDRLAEWLAMERITAMLDATPGHAGTVDNIRALI